jgi:hypothetical protein
MKLDCWGFLARIVDAYGIAAACRQITNIQQ